MPAFLLTAIDIKNARCPTGKGEIRLADGRGLFVRVGEDGYKAFVVRFAGRLRTLGQWPELSLAEARKRAAELRPIRRGQPNPIDEARERERQAKLKAQAEQRRQAADGTAKELFERFMELPRRRALDAENDLWCAKPLALPCRGDRCAADFAGPARTSRARL